MEDEAEAYVKSKAPSIDAAAICFGVCLLIVAIGIAGRFIGFL